MTGAVICALLAGMVGCDVGWTQRPAPTPTVPSRAAPTPVPERLVPTPRATVGQARTPTDAPVPELPDAPVGDRSRFGIGVPGAAGDLSEYTLEVLGFGWYLNWWVDPAPDRPGGASFWQMVRVSQEGYEPGKDKILAATAANPGATWIIGNEPDVRWQDNTTPERYAEVYHEMYHLLKAADAESQVAVGGVSQPTPLRLAYLDRVLEAYRAEQGAPMPVDVWTVHNFMLREERDGWGVDIPPGIDAQAGVPYGIDDHDDLEAFAAQILAFRRWLAERGYRDRPLALTEYGILMPSDYGFPPDRVEAFMVATFDYLLTAHDDQVGYPGDGNRLVQWWAWYSLADTKYPTGNLFDPQTRLPTELGSAFASYEPPSHSATE